MDKEEGRDPRMMGRGSTADICQPCLTGGKGHTGHLRTTETRSGKSRGCVLDSRWTAGARTRARYRPGRCPCRLLGREREREGVSNPVPQSKCAV